MIRTLKIDGAFPYIVTGRENKGESYTFENLAPEKCVKLALMILLPTTPTIARYLYEHRRIVSSGGIQFF